MLLIGMVRNRSTIKQLGWTGLRYMHARTHMFCTYYYHLIKKRKCVCASAGDFFLEGPHYNDLSRHSVTRICTVVIIIIINTIVIILVALLAVVVVAVLSLQSSLC